MKISSKIKQYTDVITKPKEMSGYRQIFKSVLYLWKEHHTIVDKYNGINRRFSELQESNRKLKEAYTKKCMMIEQMMDDFGLEYSKEKKRMVKTHEII